MGIESRSVVICDRCKSECDGGADDLRRLGWAWFSVVLGERTRIDNEVLCGGCASAVREHLDAARRECLERAGASVTAPDAPAASFPFKIGDRVRSKAGDGKGHRGTVTSILPGTQCPVWFSTDSGGEVRCATEMLEIVPPPPSGWSPACGDVVVVLCAPERYEAVVTEAEHPRRIFVVGVSGWGRGGHHGPLVSSDLELVREGRGRAPGTR